MRSKQFYDKIDVEFKLNTEVIELDSDAKTVKLSTGDTIKYDKALIASGADPQRLPFIPGWDAKNVHVLRTVEEAGAIYQETKDKNVFIVGSSFIGMETAACIAKNHAKSVTVIGMEKVPFERVLGLEIGTIMQEFHERNGVKLIMEAICQEFKVTAGQVTQILLKNGTLLDNVDIVIIGAGVVPALKYLKLSEKLKLHGDKSLVVDKYLQTGADGLFAAGDIARYPFHMLDGELVRIEHWGMAMLHGKIAALNMLQQNPSHPVEAIPVFWTQQYGKSIRYCGHGIHYEEIILDKGANNAVLNPTNPTFVAYYIWKGNVIAACSMNRDPIIAEVSELFHNRVSIMAAQIKKYIEENGSADSYIKSLLHH